MLLPEEQTRVGSQGYRCSQGQDLAGKGIPGRQNSVPQGRGSSEPETLGEAPTVELLPEWSPSQCQWPPPPPCHAAACPGQPRSPASPLSQPLHRLHGTPLPSTVSWKRIFTLFIVCSSALTSTPHRQVFLMFCSLLSPRPK